MNFKEIKRVLLKILVLNWLVAFAKIFIGFFSGSLSILADGIHSLFDGLTNIVGWVGIRFAEKPADKDHPYGHRKYEAIFSMIILVFLGITAYEILESIIRKFSNPSSVNIDWLYIMILGACIIVDALVARYEYRKGKELKSVILRADSSHTKSHYITTGAVILGSILIKLGLPVVIDAVIAGFVVLFIGHLGYEILKEIMTVLSDKAFIDEEKIKEIIKRAAGIKTCHEIRTRGDEAHIFMDLHVVLDGGISLSEAHEICDRLEKMITAEVPEIKDITVHPEPDEKK